MQINNDAFNLILDQVFQEISGKEGKGYQRHGMGKPLGEQPWVKITENVGDGFLLGQALKKIFELKSKDPETDISKFPAWKKEILGAIVYLVFAVLWKEHKLAPKIKLPDFKEILDNVDKVSVGSLKAEFLKREASKFIVQDKDGRPKYVYPETSITCPKEQKLWDNTLSDTEYGDAD